MDYDVVICCDGGLRHADALGICPDYILGDFDSVDPDLLAKYERKSEIVTFQREKDFTDTELAVRFAIDKKAVDILILGGIGSRFDHSLANVHVLLYALKAGVRAAIVNEHNKIFLADSCAELTGGIGSLVSLIPLTSKVSGVTTRGLMYPLRGETLVMGAARGVSNVILGETAEIFIESGVLIIIQACD